MLWPPTHFRLMEIFTLQTFLIFTTKVFQVFKLYIISDGNDQHTLRPRSFVLGHQRALPFLRRFTWVE